METARTGRTRYLVVVSRPAKCRQQNPQQTPSVNNAQNIRQNSSLISLGLEKQNTVFKKTNITKYTHSSKTNNKSDISKIMTTPATATTVSSGNSDILQSASCDTLNGSNTDPKNTRNRENVLNCDETLMNSIKRNCNEVEESCLLGIDCNEKTTVGLVLRILADTSIRLDGDG